MKNFDKWNTIKKHLDETTQDILYHSGDVWWCVLGNNIGHEQDGTGEYFERPVLIIKDFNAFVCLVVPLTSKRKQGKFYFDVGIVDGKHAYAILSQIRLVSTKRLRNKIGHIPFDLLDKIKKAIWDLIR